MNFEQERAVLKRQAVQSVKNVIKGEGSFHDVVILCQNQLADEFTGLTMNPVSLSQAILLMVKQN